MAAALLAKTMGSTIDIRLVESEQIGTVGVGEAGGAVYRELGELFTESAWLQVMLGQNMAPRSYHSIVDGISSQQLRDYLNNLKTIIQGAVRQFPTHEEFISQHCAAPSP